MGFLNDKFGVIYCINLKERTDRMNNIMTSFPNESIIRIDAINGKDLNNIDTKLKIAEIACTMSHIKVLETFAMSGVEMGLIIEDDVTPSKNYNEDVINNAYKHLPPDWDVLYLGANHIKPPKLVVHNNNNLRRNIRSLSTCAYVVKKNYAEYLLENINITKSQIDVQLDKLKRGKHFCIFPSVITQIPGYSNILETFVDYSNII